MTTQIVFLDGQTLNIADATPSVSDGILVCGTIGVPLTNVRYWNVITDKEPDA